MTPEQKQQIEQIQERQEHNKSAASDNPIPKFLATAYNDIDFLLSLVKSQEAPSRDAQEAAADIVREWSEHDMNENYGSDYLVDEFGAGHLEERIAVGITNAATSMRSACVEKVKALRDEWNTEAQDPRADLKNLIGVRARAKVDAANEAIIELETLSIDQPKEQG